MHQLNLTIVGNLTDDPDLKFIGTGDATVKFTLAHTPRIKRNGEWVDGEVTFMDCIAWRQLAENIAETLRKGHRVIAQGTLRTERWKDKESGQTRTKVVMDVQFAGPEITFATANVKKLERQRG